MIAGKLFNWVKFAVENRKCDVVRRLALIQRERDERDNKIRAQQEREVNREKALNEASEKFKEEHREEIEAYNAYLKSKETGGDEYGEEEEEEDEKKQKEPPKLPVFNQEEFLEKWDDETPIILIAPSTENHKDNDWDLNEDEIAEQIKLYWGPAPE